MTNEFARALGLLLLLMPLAMPQQAPAASATHRPPPGSSMPLIAPPQAELTASDAEPGDALGGAVSVSGDTILVGAPASHASDGFLGAAYVYTRSGADWIEQAKLTASDGMTGDFLGSSVALAGDLAVAGAPAPNFAVGGTGPGSAYVFTRRNGTWTERARLVASDGVADDQFGASVGVSGATIAVGAKGQDYGGGVNPGAAYVFVANGAGWVEEAKLGALDEAAGYEFGISIAADGDTVVVGARMGLTPFGVANPGAAYVFTRVGTSWSQQAKLTAFDGVPGDSFGTAVSISGDTVVVGADSDSHAAGQFAGSAYVFVRQGTEWTEQMKLTASDATLLDGFGRSVVVSGDVAVVGAWMDSPSGMFHQEGSSYVFLRAGTTWTEQAKLTASDAHAGDLFGLRVGLSADTIVAGSSQHAHSPGIGAGAAYVFRLQRGRPTDR